MSVQTIWLIRHGDRESDRREPCHLVASGYKQAEKIAEWLVPWQPEVILSSPKIRCIETGLPTATQLGLKVQVWPVLIEHNSYGPLDYSAQLIEEAGGILDTTRLLDETPQREELPFAYQRATQALRWIRDLGVERVGVFAHDCFNSVFLWAWLGLGCLDHSKRFYQSPAHINVLSTTSPLLVNWGGHLL